MRPRPFVLVGSQAVVVLPEEQFVDRGAEAWVRVLNSVRAGRQRLISPDSTGQPEAHGIDELVECDQELFHSGHPAVTS